MLHSRDLDIPELDETELRDRYERVLGRSAQLRARRAHRRAAAGTAALACLVVAGLVTASLAATTPRQRTVAGSSANHASPPATVGGSSARQTTWRLVSDVSAAGSSWRALSPSGYEQTFSLVCPSGTTCYADSVNGHLEYTHDGGATWQQAAGTGTATSLPQISCMDAQSCDVLADIAGRGSTFLTTTDGGQSWTTQPGPALPAHAVPSAPIGHLPGLAMSCATLSSCVVIAYDGSSSVSSSEVFRTSDGGASWTEGAFPAPASGSFVPSGLSCSGTSCIAVGSVGLWQSALGPGGRAQGVRDLGGAAYTSDDGGVTWSASSAPWDFLTSLTCSDATDCHAISPSGVFATEDGGQTWDQVQASGLPGPFSSGWNFIAMSCASSSSCWLTGAGPPPGLAAGSSGKRAITIGQARGLIASTADGGTTWAPSAVPAGVGGVIDVTCPDTSTCFALGVEQTGSAPRQGEVVLLTNAS